MLICQHKGIYTLQEREDKQLKYIKEYAKAHNIHIVKIMHRDVAGQEGVNRHFKQILRLIADKKVDGIILSNMMTVSRSITDAYLKVGMAKRAGGYIVTVDEGRLEMDLKEVC